MRQEIAKYLVNKLEHEKKMQELQSSNQINKAKMLEEMASFGEKKAASGQNIREARQKQMVSGQLGYQSTNEGDGYNYPIIDMFAKKPM